MKALLMLLLMVTPAMADLRNDSPRSVLHYLDSLGLSPSAGWNKSPGHGWIASRWIGLRPAGEKSRNGLGVVYSGHETRVTTATLSLNVFNLDDELRHLNIFADA